MTQLLTLRRGDLVAVVAPDLGGRVLSFTRAGDEVLWRNTDLLDADLQPREAVRRGTIGFGEWLNWGGDKSWVAPQGWDSPDLWPGPPDPTFDGGVFSVHDLDLDSVGLVSADDPATGVRMRRDIAVTADGMTVRTTLTNVGEVSRTWAAWEVVQLPIEAEDLRSGSVLVRTSRAASPHVLHRLVGDLPVAIRDGVTEVQLTDAVGKLGFPDYDGWIEYRRASGVGLRLSSAVARGPHPDDSPAQLWVQTPQPQPIAELDGFRATAALLELELVSRLATLAPGESVDLPVRWTLL
ncbi:DUF4380 domain-containing protein [Microbacterium sp. ZW T5_56]|uniref:DUF4380 domain-containing protein n=1 Tax=Microbacterium sp. ZW T5_56 TaxID=3378081 RepID=UPI0038518683